MKKYLPVFGIVGFVIVLYMIIFIAASLSNECTAKGGVLVKTIWGAYRCAELK